MAEDNATMGGAASQAGIMTKHKPMIPAAAPSTKKPGDKAFDIWLKQGLHKIFDDVAREPIPSDLLKLIEEHRDE